MALTDEIRRLTQDFLRAYDTRDDQESARLAEAAEDARGRAEYVGGVRSDTAVLLRDLDAAHGVMAAELHQRLAEERADLSDARQVWSSFNALMQQRRAGRPAVPSAPPPPVEKVMAPPPSVEEVAAPPAAVEAPPEAVEEAAPPLDVVEEEVAPDDLTAIRGIGAGMQQRLNEAGFHTFAELAESPPEELRQILGDVGRLAKVEEWIEEARTRIGMG